MADRSVAPHVLAIPERAMIPRPTRPSLRPRVEPLEGRRLPSGLPRPAAGLAVAAVNPADGSGAPALLAAFRGGAGREFASLLRREVPNFLGVIRQFATGQRTELRVKGFALQPTGFEPGYRGPRLDQFNAVAAGGLLRGRGRLEMGAILRGPIDRPESTTYVWGLGRGGPSASPAGFGPEGLGYDSAITVTRTGTTVAAAVTDFRTGVATGLPPSAVKIQGPTIRVFVDRAARLLPPTGRPLARYRFAFWTRDASAGLAAIGSVVPRGGMIPIARG